MTGGACPGIGIGIGMGAREAAGAPVVVNPDEAGWALTAGEAVRAVLKTLYSRAGGTALGTPGEIGIIAGEETFGDALGS